MGQGRRKNNFRVNIFIMRNGFFNEGISLNKTVILQKYGQMLGFRSVFKTGTSNACCEIFVLISYLREALITCNKTSCFPEGCETQLWWFRARRRLLPGASFREDSMAPARAPAGPAPAVPRSRWVFDSHQGELTLLLSRRFC
uniref:Uncharacterized protein n=1 Tax=Rousettus aegyptiacus TaxID=9407 RepID=A0A7J8F112_ROUAE|nr:hypothetical protein HJG63_012440 [Rousettus aegyptiacus]